MTTPIGDDVTDPWFVRCRLVRAYMAIPLTLGLDASMRDYALAEQRQREIAEVITMLDERVRYAW